MEHLTVIQQLSPPGAFTVNPVWLSVVLNVPNIHFKSLDVQNGSFGPFKPLFVV